MHRTSLNGIGAKIVSEVGTLQITNLVTMEVSARSATVREDNNNYRNIMSDIAEHAMHNGRISVPKPALVILEGQRI